MVTGFLAVPLFTFVVPKLGAIGALIASLSELPPSVLLSALVGIGVSLGDRDGAARLQPVEDELRDARAP